MDAHCLEFSVIYVFTQKCLTVSLLHKVLSEDRRWEDGPHTEMGRQGDHIGQGS